MMSRIPIRTHAAFSTPGTRPAQEDHSLILPEKGIFVLADGFGGGSVGSAAAKIACDSVDQFLTREAGDREATMPFVLRSYFSLAGNVLFNALLFANQGVMKLNRGKGIHEKGGASLIAGFLDGDLLALGSVGACTAFLFRNGEAKELVNPRSYSRMIDPFEKEPVSEFNRVPLAAIGMGDDVEPEIFEYRLRPGDWLTLQSDGIPAGVVETLKEIQKREPLGASAEALDELQERLRSERYSDNASLLLSIF